MFRAMTRCGIRLRRRRAAARTRQSAWLTRMPGPARPCRLASRTAPGGHQRQRVRVELVLGGENARRQRLRRVAVRDRHRRLGDDRAGIHLGHHEMHRAAGDPDAGRSACSCVCSPLNDGSSEGWMLIMPPVPARRRSRPVSTRMKPARQTSSAPTAAQRGVQRRPRTRSRRRMPCDRRRASACRAPPPRRGPPHPAGWTITATISAG